MALSHAYTTLLSTLHERSSLLSTPSATVPPSLHRTLKRQIDSFAKAVEQQQQRATEQDAKDVRAKWDRIKEALERDEDGRKVLVAATDSHPILTTLSEPPPPPPSASQQQTQHLDDEPYRDDVDPLAPAPPEQNNASLLQAQRRIFDDQDTQLDALSISIGRQHELGLRMNEELELQGELLEDLDGDVERTGLRLGRASGQLQRVSRKVKDHGSLCALFGLIVLLMALIILFK